MTEAQKAATYDVLRGQWRIGCYGSGRRTWFVLRDTPGRYIPAEYLDDCRGVVRRFATPASARRAAGALNQECG